MHNHKQLGDQQHGAAATTNVLDALVHALTTAPLAAAPREKSRFNPRPKNSVLPGGATAALLEVLRANPDRWMSRAALQWRLRRDGRSEKSLDWALLQIRAARHAEVRTDSTGRLVYRCPGILARSAQGAVTGLRIK